MFSDDKWIMMGVSATTYLVLAGLAALFQISHGPVLSGAMGAVSGLVGYAAREAWMRRNPGRA